MTFLHVCWNLDIVQGAGQSFMTRPSTPCHYSSQICRRRCPSSGTLLCNIVFKYPVALKFNFYYTQYNSVNNATISITSSLHDMFRPQTDIIRCLSYVWMSPHKERQHHHIQAGWMACRLRGKTITTTTYLHTENNMQTHMPLQNKNQERVILNHIIWTTGRSP
jgi:hypothetical protein